jgi:ankyrin repeat protein
VLGFKQVVEVSEAIIAMSNHTTLHQVCHVGKLWACKLLIGQQCDVNAVDLFGNTPLHCAISAGHESVCKLLIDQQCDVNAVDRFGNTPLDCAISAGHEPVCKLQRSHIDRQAADRSWVQHQCV